MIFQVVIIVAAAWYRFYQTIDLIALSAGGITELALTLS